MKNSELIKLIDHLLWADNKIWDCVLSNKSLSGDENIRNTLFHSHMTQDAFYHIWINKDFDIPRNESFEEITAVKKYADQTFKKIKEYSADINEVDLDKEIDVPWSKYFEESTGKIPEETTLGDTILQVIMHTTYHRGQISKRIRELDHEPPLVDYIVWLWAGQPEAQSD